MVPPVFQTEATCTQEVVDPLVLPLLGKLETLGLWLRELFLCHEFSRRYQEAEP